MNYNTGYGHKVSSKYCPENEPSVEILDLFVVEWYTAAGRLLKHNIFAFMRKLINECRRIVHSSATVQKQTLRNGIGTITYKSSALVRMIPADSENTDVNH